MANPINGAGGSAATTTFLTAYNSDANAHRVLTVDSAGTIGPGVTATTISFQGETSVTTTVVLIAANASRKKATVQNHGAANVRLSKSGTATSASPIVLVPRVGMYEFLPEGGYVYQGAIAVVSESGTNLVGFTEEV